MLLLNFSSPTLRFSFRVTCRISSYRGGIARCFVGSHFYLATAHRKLTGTIRHGVVRVKSCKQLSAISMICCFGVLFCSTAPKASVIKTKRFWQDDHLTGWPLWRQMWAIRIRFGSIMFLKRSYSTFNVWMPLWFVAQRKWSVLCTLECPRLVAGRESCWYGGFVFFYRPYMQVFAWSRWFLSYFI